MKRSEALAYRIHAQQLDRVEAERPITDAAVFDFGVQDTGRDGASWALLNRGVPIRDATELETSPAVALVWTLRAAPHYYRRIDLPEILVATSPLSDRDAAKRIVGADKPLKRPEFRPPRRLPKWPRSCAKSRLVRWSRASFHSAYQRPRAPYLRCCGPAGPLIPGKFLSGRRFVRRP